MTTSRPLTEAQEGLWYAQRVDPRNPIFNTGQWVELRGALDRGAFASAVERAVAESPALTIRVVETAEGVEQQVRDGATVSLAVVDLTVGPGDPLARARAWMASDMRRPRDPRRDSLVDEVLLVLGDDHHVWYQCIHHLVIDGYGTALITRRVAELYSALIGTGEAGPALGSYQAVLDEDAAYRASPRRDAERDYWQRTLAGAVPARSLADDAALSDHDAHRTAVALSDDVTRGVKALAAAADVPWPDAIVTLVAAYIARHTGNDDVVLGVPYMARLGTPAARVPAMVMNVIPARLPVDEDRPLVELVADHARVLRTGRRHGRYRGEQIRRDLGLVGPNTRLHGPLVNVLPFDEPLAFAGLAASIHRLGTGPVDDITITFWGASGGETLTLEIEANPRLHAATVCETHATRLAGFLERAADAPTLAAVRTLTPAEQARWVVAVNDTRRDVPDVTLVDLIEATMRRAPSAPALTDGDRALSYAEFDALTARVGDALASHGVVRGDIVAVAMPRSIERSIALVGVLRAGAAYLPIDTDLPGARIASMFDSAKPRCVVVGARDLPNVPSAPARVSIEQLVAGHGASRGDANGQRARPEPADAAYVIYTSGSTGVPKGVLVEHRAIVNRLEWMREHYAFDDGDRILQKTPFTFDVSVWELFLPFIAGGVSVIAPPDAHRDPLQLASIIREQRITTTHFVPSMLDVFLADPASRGLEIRRVFCSGEALPAHLRDRFHAIVRGELHNLYGPTEAAVDVTYWEAGPSDRSAPVPIGFPVWNTRMYVLDGRLRPLPPGVAGRLFIAGVQLARGYVGRDDFTRERFVNDPFVSGERMYDTGDVAAWRDDGALVFLGRSDHQVKIRGQRVELQEIEAALLAVPGVASAAVIARANAGSVHSLVGYVVPARDTSLDDAALRAALDDRLPGHMIPDAFVLLDALPVTSNGKLDRAALPTPARGDRPGSGRHPSTPSERRVAELFQSLLKEAGRPVDVIHADDDFFRLGGHSLLAARLMIRVREACGHELGIGALFANPTVERFARLIDGLASDVNPSRDLGLEVLIRLDGPATEAQAPLFCVHPAGGISWCYAGLARTLGAARAVYGLQARGLSDASALPASLDEMADHYIAAMRSVQPHGPYHLAGWSIGGIVAQAMGVRLRDAGENVAPIVLLDAYPSDRWRNEDEAPADAALRAVLLIAGFDPAALGLTRPTAAEVIAFLRDAGHPLATLSDDALHGVMRVVAHNNALVRKYEQRRFDGTLLHFRAARDHAGTDISPGEWLPYAAELRTFDVDALHAHMTGPAASRAVAERLSHWHSAGHSP